MHLRNALRPCLSPIDKIRLELDEYWPHGANLANIDGQKMFVGVVRLMESKYSHLSEETPHIDSIVSDKIVFDKQFSAIIYLRVPQSGGELEIWDTNPPTVFDKSWRSRQPDPYIIVPEARELVLINTKKPHAVKAFENGQRIAIQCFVGFRENEPILLWS